MDKEFLIKLTNSLYRITLLFPKKEPLRYKTRELADGILDNFTRIESNTKFGKKDKISQLLEDIEVLDSYFAIAKEQVWIASEDILSIWEKYGKVKTYIKDLDREIPFFPLLIMEKENKEIVENKEQERNQLEKPRQEQIKKETDKISSRQEKIINFLRLNRKAQVGEFQKIFPEITKRTLRRDFVLLLNQGIVERMGQKNNTFYVIKES